MTYYKCHCEYCNGDFVASVEDLHESALHFGMPKVANDEYAWKCPICGHPNTGKNKDLQPCYQNGKTNIVFELTNNETKAAIEFKNTHRHKEEFAKQGKIFFSAMGHQFTYEITPGGIGHCLSIKCNECGETKDITDNW
jgi:hypothetical protein